eukprot:9178273-Pyramimonas_sp.AAC.1
MLLLRSQLPEFESESMNTKAKEQKPAGQKVGVTRFDSQFHQSLTALRSQGVDAPGTATDVQPKSIPYTKGRNLVGTPSKLGYGLSPNHTYQPNSREQAQTLQEPRHAHPVACPRGGTMLGVKKQQHSEVSIVDSAAEWMALF